MHDSIESIVVLRMTGSSSSRLNTARADPARDGLSTEPMDINSSCVTSKHARDAKISEGVWDPQSHTTVCGGCASAGWQSQAAKRSSGFPEGNT